MSSVMKWAYSLLGVKSSGETYCVWVRSNVYNPVLDLCF